MDNFLWWTGAVTWGILGVVAVLEFGDLVIDRVVGSIWTKREFLSFVWDRLKAKGDRHGGET